MARGTNAQVLLKHGAERAEALLAVAANILEKKQDDGNEAISGVMHTFLLVLE